MLYILHYSCMSGLDSLFFFFEIRETPLPEKRTLWAQRAGKTPGCPRLLRKGQLRIEPRTTVLACPGIVRYATPSGTCLDSLLKHNHNFDTNYIPLNIT